MKPRLWLIIKFSKNSEPAAQAEHYKRGTGVEMSLDAARTSAYATPASTFFASSCFEEAFWRVGDKAPEEFRVGDLPA